MTGAPPSKLRAWILATRPKTLVAAFVPVAVGSAVAHAVGGFRAVPALAALFGAVGIQIGTNLANDVFDHEKGADTEERLGPLRVVQAGLLSARTVKVGMALSFAFAAAMGVYLVVVGGWPIVVIGVLSVLSGMAYTGGPYPLGYHGLGDVFVFVFFGFVAVCGTVWVQVGAVPPLAWWASLPVGALATAILVVNNVRDRNTDVKAGKRTLAVRFGRRFGVFEYGALLLVAYAVPAGLAAAAWASPLVLLPWLTAPLGIACLRRLATDEGAALNATLAKTAGLLFLHGLLFAVGLAAAGVAATGFAIPGWGAAGPGGAR